MFLDPPYGIPDRADLYGIHEDRNVSADVREWCLKWDGDQRMRIALCGYEGEHEMPDSWECFKWKARGGYGSQAADSENANAERERIWFSPSCNRQVGLFDLEGA